MEVGLVNHIELLMCTAKKLKNCLKLAFYLLQIVLEL